VIKIPGSSSRSSRIFQTRSVWADDNSVDEAGE